MPEQFAGRRVALDTMLAGVGGVDQALRVHGEIEHAVGNEETFHRVVSADVVQELAGAAEAADHAAN